MQQPMTDPNMNMDTNQEPLPEEPIEESKPKKTYFQTHKELGDPFFKNSRITSCSHVLVKNGRCLAIPFGIKNRRGRGLNHFKQYQKNYHQINQFISLIIFKLIIYIVEWEKNL